MQFNVQRQALQRVPGLANACLVTVPGFRKAPNTRLQSFCRCIISGFMHKVQKGDNAEFLQMHKAYHEGRKRESAVSLFV